MAGYCGWDQWSSFCRDTEGGEDMLEYLRRKRDGKLKKWRNINPRVVFMTVLRINGTCAPWYTWWR